MAQLTDTTANACRFDNSNLTYVDLSNANLSQSVLAGCELHRCNLHNIIEEDTDWYKANRNEALATDPKRLNAQQWQKPPAKR